MTSLGTAVLLVLVAAVGFTLAGIVVTAVIVMLSRGRILALAPRQRHAALIMLAALPVLVGLSLASAASLPPLLALADLANDHCNTHDGHAHLCFAHAPHGGVRPELLIVLGLLATVLITQVVAGATRVLRLRGVIRMLLASGEQHPHLGVTVVEPPVCMTIGFMHPRIVVGRGLLEQLGDVDRDIVIAHERAHVRRKDALTLAIVRSLCHLHLPFVARWIDAELRCAAEQACDEEAAMRVGDRLAVASTILAVQRLGLDATGFQLGGAAMGFDRCAIERRVESLLVDARRARSLRAPAFSLAAVIVLGLGAAGELHHWTESMLSLVAL